MVKLFESRGTYVTEEGYHRAESPDKLLGEIVYRKSLGFVYKPRYMSYVLTPSGLSIIRKACEYFNEEDMKGVTNG